MVASALQSFPAPGLHVAIIMDGNGRWATARGFSRSFGHHKGARTVRGIVEAAPTLGISTLTLYAFSADNWRRPPREVAALMRLLRVYLHSEIATCLKNDIRMSIIGRREGLPPHVLAAIEEAEAATAGGRMMNLRIAINYSAREAIVRAAGRMSQSPQPPDPSFQTFARLLGEACHTTESAPDVDLLIRTGGEQRLSDFLLWECAYAELYFTPRMWPDFTAADLDEAVSAFRGRDRRFGHATSAGTVAVPV